MKNKRIKKNKIKNKLISEGIKLSLSVKSNSCLTLCPQCGNYISLSLLNNPNTNTNQINKENYVEINCLICNLSKEYSLSEYSNIMRIMQKKSHYCLLHKIKNDFQFCLECRKWFCPQCKIKHDENQLNNTHFFISNIIDIQLSGPYSLNQQNIKNIKYYEDFLDLDDDNLMIYKNPIDKKCRAVMDFSLNDDICSYYRERNSNNKNILDIYNEDIDELLKNIIPLKIGIDNNCNYRIINNKTYKNTKNEKIQSLVNNTNNMCGPMDTFVCKIKNNKIPSKEIEINSIKDENNLDVEKKIKYMANLNNEKKYNELKPCEKKLLKVVGDNTTINNIYEFMNKQYICNSIEKIPSLNYNNDYQELVKENIDNKIFKIKEQNVFIGKSGKRIIAKDAKFFNSFVINDNEALENIAFENNRIDNKLNPEENKIIINSDSSSIEEYNEKKNFLKKKTKRK